MGTHSTFTPVKHTGLIPWFQFVIIILVMLTVGAAIFFTLVPEKYLAEQVDEQDTDDSELCVSPRDSYVNLEQTNECTIQLWELKLENDYIKDDYESCIDGEKRYIIPTSSSSSFYSCMTLVQDCSFQLARAHERELDCLRGSL